MTMKMKKNKNPHFIECKMCCLRNKNNLSYINGYIYVMMLIVDNIWKESLDHFCGWVIRTICYVWIHICNDIDSGQDMEKAIRKFLCFTNGIFLFTFWITKNVNWDFNFHAIEQHKEHCDTLHLFSTTSAKFYYLWMETQDLSNCGEIKHLVAWGRHSKWQDFLLC
jgi:hypothetical protein